MTHLPFLGGAVAGVVMSTVFWLGLSVFWEAVGKRSADDVDSAARRRLRAALGLVSVVLALLPAYVLYRDESWPVLRGYGAGAAAAALVLFIELVRASKSQNA